MLTEQKIAEQMEQDYKVRLDKEIKKLNQMDPLQKEVYGLRLQV